MPKYLRRSAVFALAVFAVQASAETEDQARLRKLEAAVGQLQKENAALRQTIDQGAPAPAAIVNPVKLSDSVTELRLYGEGRLRYFYNQGTAAGLDAGDNGERDRLRYRLRLGADLKLQEHWLLGVQVEGNNSARSANVTLGENPFFAKGTISKGNFVSSVTANPGASVTGIDAATGKTVTVRTVAGLTARTGSVVTNVNYGDQVFFGRAFLRNDPTPWLTLTGGRMPNPFVTTRMVWDPDISPEGLAEQFHFTIGGESGTGKDVVEHMKIDLFANFGQFIYDDVGFENSFNNGNGPFTQVPSRVDRWMLGWQLGARAHFTRDTYLQVAPALFNYTGGGLTSSGPFNGDSPLIAVDKNANPLLITFNQTGTNDLTFLEVPVEFGWKWHDVPFSVFGDFAYNFDASQRAEQAGHPDKHEGMAYQAGAGFGRSEKKGDFQLRGWWQHSEAYALDQNIVDDDIFDGRLNMEGFYVQASYNLTDAVSVIVQYSRARRIDHSLGTPGFGALGTAPGFPLDYTSLLYVDLNLKF